MKNRRWFTGPQLSQWRYMQTCGEYSGPFWSFPNNPSGIDPWEMGRRWRNEGRILSQGYLGPLEGPYGFPLEREP